MSYLFVIYQNRLAYLEMQRVHIHVVIPDPAEQGIEGFFPKKYMYVYVTVCNVWAWTSSMCQRLLVSMDYINFIL
jgi:hypothetical protein